MGLQMSKKARAKRWELRTSHIDESKKYTRKKDAYNKALRTHGSQAAVYLINHNYYPGKKSEHPYLKELKVLEAA